MEITLPSPTPEREIVVYVTGEVASPGLYTLPPGQHRLLDAVEAAGGFTANADPSSVNGAMIIADQDHVNVGAMTGASKGDAPAAGGLINLNTASSQQLQTLPGIGPGRAGAIIEHRQSNGPFGRIEDLLEVSGIGEAIFESIQHLITAR